MIAVKNGFSAGRYPGSSASVHTSRSLGTTSRKQPMLGNSLPSGERITVRKMPPGRRSISQSETVHGAGVNHLRTCSGPGRGRPDQLARYVDDALEHEVEAGIGFPPPRGG